MDSGAGVEGVEGDPEQMGASSGLLTDNRADSLRAKVRCLVCSSAGWALLEVLGSCGWGGVSRLLPAVARPTNERMGMNKMA